MIRCEHCGSMLPDGAIFCGECGRAVTAAAGRRPAVPTPIEQAPPPPLQQPDVHGRRHDPATDAWLPEATLDPATRAWLTSGDRADVQPPAVPVQRPDDHAPRSAPTHVHGADSGLRPATDDDADAIGQPPRQGPPEPDLDPNAYPSVAQDVDDPEVTRVAERPVTPPSPAPFEEPSTPVWTPPVQQEPSPAPTGPSWWVDRSTTASGAAPGGATHEPDAGSVTETETGEPTAADATTSGDSSAISAPGTSTQAALGTDDARERHDVGDRAVADDPDETASTAPRPGDTAVVEPLVDRRPRRPVPLVAPGSHGTTCHVCGHTLEPDDIFCAECGAVRPAVTAAFTGPIVPLPMDRPDWAANDSVTARFVGADATTDGDGSAEPDQPVEPGQRDDELDDEIAVSEDAAPSPDRAGDGVSLETDATPDDPADGTHPTSPPTSEDAAGPDTAGLVLSLPTTDEAPTSADGGLDDDDVEATRIVSKAPTSAPFVLHFSTGERFGVDGTGLVGRLPRPQPGERFDDLLTVHDPGKSVSKTHLELGRDGDDLWVSDRFSGNGTVVRHIDGSIRRCEPGRRYRVERGARVDIGEQFFLVQ